MQKLSELFEEALERYWMEMHEHTAPSCGDAPTDETISGMVSAGLIEIDSNGKIILTAEGDFEGAKIVRRHRLAEKLLTDVLGIDLPNIDETACQLEHHLTSEFEDRVCMLLGHPRSCPHGKSIPPGSCCNLRSNHGNESVVNMSRMKVGQKGKISFVGNVERGNLQSLSSMGVLPGVEVTVKQIYPSFLFELGNSEFAVDTALADAIHIRVEPY